MPEPKRPLKVFLCHTSADKPSVRDLYNRLTADGVDAWLDAENLIAGQNWRVEIPKAIRESDVVIVCLSEKSINKEGYVQKEIKFALDVADEKPEETIFIVPVRLGECVVPDRLNMYHWVDLFRENGYEKLKKALILRSEQLGADLNNTRQIIFSESRKTKISLDGKINILANLASTALRDKEYKKSLEYYQQALNIAYETKDIYSQSIIASGLGNVYWLLGDHAQSREHFKGSLHWSQELGDKRLEVAALNNLGFTFESIGDLVRATELYERALSISKDIGL